MSTHRTTHTSAGGSRSDERLADEAARWRRQLREAQQVISEQNRMLLGTYLRERLADPGDFDVYIGVDQVTTRDGRILWTRVDALLSELLAAKPHLATPSKEFPWRRGASAVSFFTTEDTTGQGPVSSGQEPRGQRATGQGPAR